MNQRIRELWRDCVLKHTKDPMNWQTAADEFAQLIVQECAVYCEGHILPKGMAEENDLNYNDGVMDCAIGLKQDFGVE